MQIISFPSHYQLVYISFDISSFSLISYIVKRASFTVQKGIFYRIKAHLLFSMYEYLLQPFLCPFPFHNKQVSLLLHYYKNTIKTPIFQFSCHSRHSSSCYNTLITSLLCEMLKVTATKNKN